MNKEPCCSGFRCVTRILIRHDHNYREDASQRNDNTVVMVESWFGKVNEVHRYMNFAQLHSLVVEKTSIAMDQCYPMFITSSNHHIVISRSSWTNNVLDSTFSSSVNVVSEWEKSI